MSTADLSNDSAWHRLLLERVVRFFDADGTPVGERRVFEGIEHGSPSGTTIIVPGADISAGYSSLLDTLAREGLIEEASADGTARLDRAWQPTDAGRGRLAEPPTED